MWLICLEGSEFIDLYKQYFNKQYFDFNKNKTR